MKNLRSFLNLVFSIFLDLESGVYSLRTQESNRLADDQGPPKAGRAPRTSWSIQNNVYTGRITDTVVFFVKSGSICIKNSVKCFLKVILWETVRFLARMFSGFKKLNLKTVTHRYGSARLNSALSAWDTPLSYRLHTKLLFLIIYKCKLFKNLLTC